MPGVSTVTNRVEFQGNGTSALFNFGFPIHRFTDLGVFAFNSSATTPNTITPMTLNGGGGFGYTMQGNADPSGVYPNGANVIMNSAPNIDTVIVMFRSSVLTNDFAIGQSGNISSAGLNNELNYLTLIAQRHQDQITRSLRLPDGLPGFFDMSLPANIKSRPGQFLATNSNANGFILTDPSGGQYIENTVIIAANSSSLASLGGAASGLLLQSNGSSAPTWAAISFGSGPVPSGAIVGILSVAQGGTGTGSGYNQYGVVFACSAIDFTSTAAGGTDIPLLGNNGAGPSFRPLPIDSGSSVTGTLPVTSGGTGNAAPLPTFALLYGQAPGAVGFISTGTPTHVLTANSGLAPSYQVIPPANLITASGVLAVVSGGTGLGSWNPTQLILASSATSLSQVPGSAARRFLMSNGSNIPSYEFISASSINSVTATGGHVLKADGAGGASWLAESGGAGSVGVNQIRLAGGAPYAATNQCVRRFGGTIQNVGSSITYQSSAANGDTFTINADGIYSFFYCDGGLLTSQGATFGLTVNGQPTTGIFAQSSFAILGIKQGDAAASGGMESVSVTSYLSNGDVVRAHTNGSSTFNQIGSSTVRFSAVRLI